MTGAAPLKLAVVAGEESGDLLGADLVAALTAARGEAPALVGVGGRNLAAHGLQSLFDADDIALMGVSAIVRDLPRLVRRIGQTARAVVAARPDCLVTIDSPEFSLRVARKVRALAPDIPIVHYVCPSVWAWRPARAGAMRPYVDHVLCLLPFEPEALRRLGGPPGTFVGHRLAVDPHLRAAGKAQMRRGARPAGGEKTLLLLPGSRRGEVNRLIGPFGETVERLAARGNAFRAVIPAVPHLAPLIERAVADWSVRPEVLHRTEDKWRAFGAADAALACSGTVSLELALARVPTVLAYKSDRAARVLMPLITVWSAALPNLIADWPVVPEAHNQYVRPGYLARLIERLWSDTPVRAAQLDGFAQVARALETSRPPGEHAAETVLAQIARAGP